MKLNRRSMLSRIGKLAAYGLAAPFTIRYARGAHAQSSTGSLRIDDGSVFDLSIASGDPTSTGVILWTHVRPERVVTRQPLRFQVALDPRFDSLVLEGEVPASSAPSALADYTVKVDLDGHLRPGTRYYYRFVYGDVASRTGRCRTLPEAGARSLKLALITCQDYTNGYYAAFDDLARDDSVDFVVHLGDFIYESAADPRFQSLPFQDRQIVLPSGQGVAVDLADYRSLYRTYRSDRFLMRALEQHTWIISPDDHETANDCYWDYARDTLGAPDHPFVEDAVALRGLKLASQRAWAEYIPARVQIDETASHPHDFLSTYRDFKFGDLARISMLDSRSYRTGHPCGEGDLLERYLPLGCDDFKNPGQFILGDTQEAWLLDRLSQRDTLWNVVGNQTLFTRLSLAGKLPIDMDAWDGYDAARQRLSRAIRERDVRNLVVVTGDLHSYLAAQIKLDYDKLNPLDASNQLGVEFMTPSVTSAALFDQLLKDLHGDASLTSGLTTAAVFANNPHIRFFDSARHGYSTLTFAREYCEWVAYAIDKDTNTEAPSRHAIARMRKYVNFPQLVPQSTAGF
ncbi:MAG TPA: alkaline phosphatase D family protein [Polyangiales bacterium]